MKKQIKILLLSSTGFAPRWSKEVEKINKDREDIEILLDIFKPSDFYLEISDKRGYDRLYKKSEQGRTRIHAKSYDAVIPRVSGRTARFGRSVVKHLSENMNVFTTANARGLEISSNKWLCSQFLSKHKLRLPKQVFAHSPSDYKELIDLVGGLPCVGKTVTGSQGAGVFILETPLAASTALVALNKSGGQIVLQQFIDSSYDDLPANDLRVWVIGAETSNPELYAMRRWSLADDFRSNVSLSKSGEKVEITDEEKEMSIIAAKALKMGVCAVDIMRDAKDDFKPYILETNGNPGLKIEKIVGENVVGAVFNYVLNNYKKGGTEPRERKPEQLQSIKSKEQYVDQSMVERRCSSDW